MEEDDDNGQEETHGVSEKAAAEIKKEEGGRSNHQARRRKEERRRRKEKEEPPITKEEPRYLGKYKKMAGVFLDAGVEKVTVQTLAQCAKYCETGESFCRFLLLLCVSLSAPSLLQHERHELGGDCQSAQRLPHSEN